MIRSRLIRAIDVLGPRLARYPELAGHLQTCAKALRSDEEHWIVESLVFLEVARGLRAIGGNPRCPTRQYLEEWVDDWLTEIEERTS